MGAQFYLYPVAGDQVAGLGAHIAFSADSRAAVDAAYAAGIAGGATSVRAAGLHPDIAAGYYGAILYDPDGNKLEIVAGTMHRRFLSLPAIVSRPRIKRHGDRRDTCWAGRHSPGPRQHHGARRLRPGPWRRVCRRSFGAVATPLITPHGRPGAG